MKIVKRLLIFLLCIVMAGGILFLISIPGVNDHIAKPIQADDLLPTLVEIIGQQAYK